MTWTVVYVNMQDPYVLNDTLYARDIQSYEED